MSKKNKKPKKIEKAALPVETLDEPVDEHPERTHSYGEYPRVVFHVGTLPIREQLLSRTPPSTITTKTLRSGSALAGPAKRDLLRYYAAIDGAYSTLATESFTTNELGVIFEALRRPLIGDEIDAGNLWGYLPSLGPALRHRVQGLSRIEAQSLIDAAERFWLLPSDVRAVKAVAPKELHAD